MNQFEDQLRQTLSRKQPSADFVEKVLLKTAPRNRLWRWQAIAALAACLAGIGIYETYRYQQGQFAKQQLLLALRITSEKTHVAQQKVQQLNQRSFLP